MRHQIEDFQVATKARKMPVEADISSRGTTKRNSLWEWSEGPLGIGPQSLPVLELQGENLVFLELPDNKGDF